MIRLESTAPFDEALRLLALRRRDLRISRHEGERVEQHDLETARVEARRYLRARRERDVALRRGAAGEHANADPVQSLASGQKTGSRLDVSRLTAKPLVARPIFLTNPRPARPQERASR